MGRNKGFSKEDVLSKSLILFWKHGFADTSMKDIEKHTKVNKSGLYTDFKSKDEIFIECLKHYVQTNRAVDLLTRHPLGWINIKDFMLLAASNEKMKGCFIVNTIREMAILPSQAKTVIELHIQNVEMELITNLKYEKIKNYSTIAQLILIFNSGLSLSLHSNPQLEASVIVNNFLTNLKV